MASNRPPNEYVGAVEFVAGDLYTGSGMGRSGV